MTIDQQVLNLINQERSNEGLSPLSWNSQLDSAAESHSEDMAVNDFFSHTGLDGSSGGERITAAGYQWSQYAENIGAGYATPEDAVQGWMNSSGHRANILNPNLEHIGIGYYYLENDTGSENWNHYWTLTFGAGGDGSNGDAGDETISVGVAPNYPPYSDSNYLNEDLTERVYTFEIDETSSINLNLHDITTSNDADLYLYRDDGDGVFDLIQDQELASSRRAGNADDSINYLAEPSSYFARVERYAPGSQGSLDYELDLSATLDTPSSTEAPNLLPREIDLGDIALNSLGNQTITRSDWVGNSDTADTYNFSASGSNDGVRIDVSLTGLSSDADIRLIQDRNWNQIVDLGEVIDSSTLGSTSNESLSRYLDNFDLANYDYFLQVYQYSGDTSYDLNMTFQSTIG